MKIILVSGLPGSGKSTLANELVVEHRFMRIGSDTIRKEFFSNIAEDSCKYHPSITGAVFEIMYLRMELALQAGKSLVLDAIHAHPPGRKRVVEIAKKFGIKPLYIEIFAPKEVLVERIRNRNEDTFDSEADENVLQRYLQMSENYDWQKVKEIILAEGFSVMEYDSVKDEEIKIINTRVFISKYNSN